ncbi:MAG: hypothetical protein QM753_11545 [Thermomicrobiales bacterium]
MVQDSPESYWDFMTEIAAPVVAGLAMADDAARSPIRDTVLSLAHKAMRDGCVRLRSTAVVIAGTR